MSIVSRLRVAFATLSAKPTSVSHSGVWSARCSASLGKQRVRAASGQQLNAMALKINRLGSSDLMVTEVCLGTMTWGVQNTEEEAHAQLDYAIKERGVNFMDTAEMYPVPSSAPGHQPGRTEEYIGTWLQNNPEWRSKVIIATKVMGYSKESMTAANRFVPPSKHYPDSRLDEESILQACDASLRRLQTDYIDLYQMHWPDRYAPLWGARSYHPQYEWDAVPMKETLGAFKKLIEAGKIRHYGFSNETTFGVAEFVRCADELGMQRPVSIQNQFCLLNRQFEGELAEACAPSHYNIGLLPWSVLCGGALTGKYLGKLDEQGYPIDKTLNSSRFVLFRQYQVRFNTPKSMKAVEKYSKVAKEAGISLATLAQAWCASRWFIPSTIIGATTLEQLKENIDAFSVTLSDDVLRKVDDIHNENKDVIVSA